MANTARMLIVDAYRTAGLRGRLSEPNATETAIGLSLLNNDIVDMVRNNRLFNTYVKSYETTTVAGQSDYTIGEQQVSTIANPTPPTVDIATNQDIVRILNGQIKIGSSWVPIEQVRGSDEFRISSNEDSQIIPQSFVFNRTRDPYDTISFIQPPSGGYKVRFSVNGGVVNYSLDDEIAMPGGYYSYFKYAMSELLCLSAGLEETEIKMARKASQCLDRLEMVNLESAPLLNTGGAGGLWSIGSDNIVRGGV